MGRRPYYRISKEVDEILKEGPALEEITHSSNLNILFGKHRFGKSVYLRHNNGQVRVFFDKEQNSVTICDLLVGYGYRHMGIGSHLLEVAEEVAKKFCKVTNVNLMVDLYMDKCYVLLSWYKRHGYQIQCHDASSVLLKKEL